MNGTSTIASRITQLSQRIDQLAVQAGRQAGEVRLLPVRKTSGAEAIREAIAAGMHRPGENKAQEIREKSPLLADTAAQWVMIGHLQPNKAKEAARHA